MNLFNLGLSFSGFSIPLVSEIFMLIDWGIYSIACEALKGFYEIVDVSAKIFGASDSKGFEIIKALIKRVTTLGGIYALFKLSLLLIDTLIDPGKLQSTEKTGVQIAKNAFIAIILLLTSTFIFEKLGEFQYLVINSNLIEKVIYGDTGEGSEKNIKEKSKQFTNGMWLLFFLPNSSKSDADCNETRNKVAAGTAEIISLVGCHYKYYDYTPIAPFIVGLVLIYYFVIYCMELASRMLKLLVLEVLFPIPVIMSIDPSGKNKLSNYFKVYIPIYCQIFVRIITFYLAFAVAYMVLNNAEEIISSSTASSMMGSGTLFLELGWFLKVLIIIGVFQGMKEVPKLVEQALGIRLGNETGRTFGGYVRGLIGGTAGLVGGTVAGAVSGGFGGAVAGAASGTFRGFTNAYASKNMGAAIGQTVATIGRTSDLGKGVKKAGGLFPYIGGGIGNTFGGQTRDANRMKNFDKRLENANKNIENINKSAELRSNIQNVMRGNFEKANGTLETRMANDPTVAKWEGMVEQVRNGNLFVTDDEYVDTMARLQAAKDKVRGDYERDMDAYFNKTIGEANSNKNDADLSVDARSARRELNNYHSFNEEIGLSNREIKGNADFSRLKDADVIQIENINDQIRSIKKERKEFQEQPGVKARSAQAEYAKGGKNR